MLSIATTIKTCTTRSATLACAALLASALLAAPASALQQASAGSSAQTRSMNTSESTQSSSYSDGSLSVKITKRMKRWTDESGSERSEERTEMKATLDGKDVPTDRIRIRGDLIEILDAAGSVLRTAPAPQFDDAVGATAVAPSGKSDRVRVFTHSGSQSSGGSHSSGGAQSSSGARSSGGAQSSGEANATDRADATARALSGLRWVSDEASAPKVMLGVTMEMPDASVAQQIKVAPTDATIIMSVTPELPAAKAGLKKHDVIVAIDGKKPAGPQRIREVMGTKEPGSTMTFDVVSAGEARQVAVKLEAWDAERLGITEGATSITLVPGFLGGEVDRDMQEQIDAMMRQFQIQFDDLDVDSFNPMLGRYLAPVPGGNGRTFTFVVPRDATIDVAPATPATPAVAPATEERIRQLEERIERLNETIRRMEEHLKAAEAARPSGSTR
jgi:hypothetical protein